MADEPCTPFEERAAIMEFEAGMSRREAERRAHEDVRTFQARAEKASRKQRDLF